MKIILLVCTILLIFINLSMASGGCETYSSVQIQNTFNANFLNRDLRGCFNYYFNNQTEKLETSIISIQIGKNLTNLDQASATKLSFAAFSFINNFYQVNKKLGNDTNEILDSIRLDAKKSSDTVTNDIKQTTELIQGEGLKQYQANRSDLINESIQFNANLDNLNSSLKNEFPKAEITNDIEAKPLANIATPIQKEKDKWINLKNNQQIPFHSLSKIKNKSVFDQVLNEIKYARYIQTGKMLPEALPYLEKLQSIEKNGRIFDINYEKLRKNLDQNDSQFEPKSFALKASYQLKKISDQKLSLGELDKSSESIDMANLTLELVTSLPVAATGRGLYEFFSGKHLLTGIELSDFERGASLAVALIDMTPSAWVAKGVRGAWIAGELGAKLVEKGLVKIGFEEALNIGITKANLFTRSISNLVSRGLLKVEIAKRIVEHKLFFNYLPKEEFLEKYFEKSVTGFSNSLIKKGINLETIDLASERSLAKEAYMRSTDAIETTGLEINQKLKSYYELPPFLNDSSAFYTKSKPGEQFVRFHGETNKSGFFIARLEDVVSLNSIEEIREVLALPELPTKISILTFPENKVINLIEGRVSTFQGADKILPGGGWQVYINENVSDVKDLDIIFSQTMELK